MEQVNGGRARGTGNKRAAGVFLSRDGTASDTSASHGAAPTGGRRRTAVVHTYIKELLSKAHDYYGGSQAGCGTEKPRFLRQHALRALEETEEGTHNTAVTVGS